MQKIPSFVSELFTNTSEQSSKSLSLFADNAKKAQGAKLNKNLDKSLKGDGKADESEFEQLFKSFIEEGRTEYTGLPPGFSAYITESGTINREQVMELQRQLKKNKAHDLSIESLNQLMSSHTPMTLANIFSTLTGKSRMHEEMSDDERASFRLLLNKVGADVLESDNLMALSDRGENRNLWNSFAEKASSVPYETLDLNKTECLALLRALDVSKDTAKNILKQFGNKDSLTLGKDELNDFFSSVRSELTKKDNAHRYVQKIAREVVNDTLIESKLNEKARPVESNRGNAVYDRLEKRMQETSLEKSGVKDLYELDQDEENYSLAQAARKKDQPTKNSTSSKNLEESLEASEKNQQKNPYIMDKADEAKPEKNSTLQAQQEDFAKNKNHEKLMPDQDMIDDKDIKLQDKNGKDQPDNENNKGKTENHGTVSAHNSSENKGETNALGSFFDRIDSAFPKASSGAEHKKNLEKMAQEHKEEIFEQVKSGILRNGPNGSSRLVLQLDPKDLGQLSLILNVREGEVKASIRTEQAETAAILSGKMDELISALEEQGLKVSEIEIQQGLTQDARPDFWNGSKEHNFQQEYEARDRARRLARIRSAEPVAIKTATPHINLNLSEGIHIVA